MLRGHCGAVTGVAATPGGQLISVDAHGSVIVWRPGGSGGLPDDAAASGERRQVDEHQFRSSPEVALIRALEPPMNGMPEGIAGFKADDSSALNRHGGPSHVRHVADDIGHNNHCADRQQQQPQHWGSVCCSPTVNAAAASAAWAVQPQRSSPPAAAGGQQRPSDSMPQATAGSWPAAAASYGGSHQRQQTSDRPTLQALLGCNGGAGAVAVWRPEAGWMARAAANAVVIEELATGRQRCVSQADLVFVGNTKAV